MSGTWVEVVKQRRAELRLSVRAAARRAGVSESLWRQMENGHRPKPENVASMSLALGWSASRGLSSVIDGAEPEPCAEGEAATIGRTLTTPQNLETRVGALEDQLRAVMAIVLQIQHERQQDELRGSPSPAEATRSER